MVIFLKHSFYYLVVFLSNKQKTCIFYNIKVLLTLFSINILIDCDASLYVYIKQHIREVYLEMYSFSGNLTIQ